MRDVSRNLAARGKSVRRSRRILDLQDLDVLSVVAEIGSIRAAASALKLQPSAVSRRIRNLEERLGASLFERSRSGVTLTGAGRTFQHSAKSVLEDLDKAVRLVGEAGQASNGRIAIGVVGSLSSNFMSKLIKRFRAEHPDVVVTLFEGNNHDHLVAITDRKLDIAYVLGTLDTPACDVEHLWSEPVAAALASDDRRAAEARLPFSALAEDHFIVSQGPPGPDVHNLIVRSLSKLGVQPRISHYGVGREALILMVGLGFGTSLVCGSEMRLAYPDVTFVPLEAAEVPFSAVWLRHNDNPALRRFLSLARRLSRDHAKAAVAS